MESQPALMNYTRRRSFEMDDQRSFAAFSGDYNPMHLDSLAARRTQAGAVVVHGMHQVLWALDEIAAVLPSALSPSQIKVRFPQFLLLSEEATLTICFQADKLLRVSVTAGEVVTTNIIVKLDDRDWGSVRVQEGGSRCADPKADSHDQLDQLKSLSGELPAWSGTDEAVLRFPHASSLIGSHRINALASLSRLVGMISPGLHSIFSSIDLKLVEAGSEVPLAFSVSAIDERFSFVRQRVLGRGVEGEIEAFLRTPPSAQSTFAEVCQMVKADEFAGSVAMVVGASRGLGEFVAKAIAAGGGHVIATYSVGSKECAAVAEEINVAGGRCDVKPYDVRQPADTQLADLSVLPTSIYYFPTPKIYTRPGQIYDQSRFRDFSAVYLDGFYDLCCFLRERLGAAPLTVFYPSSVYVDARPADMTVYAMVKAAGEILCQDMPRSWPGTRIIASRLPRQKTDQTASIVTADDFPQSVPEVMLPIVREVEAVCR